MTSQHAQPIALLQRAGPTRAGALARMLLLSLTLAIALPSAADSEREQREKLEQLKQSIESLQAELRSVKSSRSDMLDALEESEKAIGELSSKVRELKGKLEHQERDLNQLRERKSELEQDKSAQQEQVGEHINAAYRLGQQSNLRLLLNQQDPSQVARNLKYFTYLSEARAKKVNHYLATLEQIGEVEQQIVQRTATLRSDQQNLQQRHQQLTAEQSKRKRTLQQLEATIASKDERLAQLERDRQGLEQLLQQVAHLLDIELPADAANFAELKGKLPWPTQGKISQRYGAARVADKVRWEGVVITAQAGTPVIAIHHGRVVFSDYLRGHGLLLIVDHGTGYMSLYGRNQALYKEIGEWVSAGETIAAVGNSGGQEAAGLYFELRHNGQPTNPQQWIKTG